MALWRNYRNEGMHLRRCTPSKCVFGLLVLVVPAGGFAAAGYLIAAVTQLYACVALSAIYVQKVAAFYVYDHCGRCLICTFHITYMVLFDYYFLSVSHVYAFLHGLGV